MLRLFFCRLLPLLVVILAVFVGYIAQSPVPSGTLFWCLAQPLQLSPNFKATPPVISTQPPLHPLQHQCLTTRIAQVPADMLPLPRPEGEVFRPLMGSGDQMPAAGLGTCCRATAYHDDSV